LEVFVCVWRRCILNSSHLPKDKTVENCTLVLFEHLVFRSESPCPGLQALQPTAKEAAKTMRSNDAQSGIQLLDHDAHTPTHGT
jgi:hypothetical protein